MTLHVLDASAMVAYLASEPGAAVVTALDHHEFDPLVPLGVVPIRFIR